MGTPDPRELKRTLGPRLQPLPRKIGFATLLPHPDGGAEVHAQLVFSLTQKAADVDL